VCRPPSSTNSLPELVQRVHSQPHLQPLCARVSLWLTDHTHRQAAHPSQSGRYVAMQGRPARLQACSSAVSAASGSVRSPRKSSRSSTMSAWSAAASATSSSMPSGVRAVTLVHICPHSPLPSGASGIACRTASRASTLATAACTFRRTHCRARRAFAAAQLCGCAGARCGRCAVPTASADAALLELF